MSGAATPRPSSGRTAVLVLVAACTGALASPAAAQTVSGRILDGDSREPITGAQVGLVDEAGLDRGAVLTGQDGRFRLRAPAPGRYRLRADRIGYRSTWSDEVALTREADAGVEILVTTEAITLPRIDV